MVRDSRSGRPLSAHRRGRLIPATPEAEQRLIELLDGAQCSWTAVDGCVRLDRDQDAEVLRSLDSGEEPVAWGVDHLLTTAERVGGNPFAEGHGRPGLDRYGSPDRSRGPVSLPLPPPRAPAADTGPRIVVLDTGLGVHPWFEHAVEHTITYADGTVAGPFHQELELPHPDTSGMVPQVLLGTLGSHVGHGTFIAGLIRQTCPAAVIVAPGIMGADGVVPEQTLIRAVEAVLRRERESPGWAAAVVLSLGFYTEEPEDLVYTSRLRLMLLELGRAGVAVFCAAGNDASDRPSFPAAFAVDPAWEDPEVVPLVSVAALTPDGAVADFSNDGPWVTAAAPGVNLVSTVPLNADGSFVPRRTWRGPGGRARAAGDGDSFRSGFACWSGTSFAAPVLAGEYLDALVRAGLPTTPSGRRQVLESLLPGRVGSLQPSSP